MRTYTSADFCADQIDVIMNLAVITNVVVKRAHCTCNCYENKTVWFSNPVMRSNDADGMTNSADPDQTAP